MKTVEDPPPHRRSPEGRAGLGGQEERKERAWGVKVQGWGGQEGNTPHWSRALQTQPAMVKASPGPPH